MLGDSSKIGKLKKIALLVVLTVVFTGVYYLIFHDMQEMYDNMIKTIINTPFNILVTGSLFNYILNRKENKKEEKQVNMLIDIFYNEIGNKVLEIIIKSDDCIEDIREFALIKDYWEEEEYQELFDKFDNFEYCIDLEKIDLGLLKKTLEDETPMIMDLMTNPNLQKNDEFNKIVMSVFHLKSELDDRYGETNMQEYEKIHIKRDIDVVYRVLAGKWVDYMYHLKEFYPQLFIKALINSPFDTREYREKDKEILGRLNKEQATK